MKFLKNNLKLIIGIIIGAILAGGIVYAATSADKVDYTTTKNAEVKNVEQALNDLYNKNKSNVSVLEECRSKPLEIHELAGYNNRMIINSGGYYLDDEYCYFDIKCTSNYEYDNQGNTLLFVGFPRLLHGNYTTYVDCVEWDGSVNLVIRYNNSNCGLSIFGRDTELGTPEFRTKKGNQYEFYGKYKYYKNN